MMALKKKIQLSRVCDFFRNDESQVFGSEANRVRISNDI